MNKLWFDVGIKRYTTGGEMTNEPSVLWFDVGIKRYTTHWNSIIEMISCGLM